MFNTKYQAGANSRLRVNRWMDWNINYSATFRAAQNSLLIDNKAADYGIERNFVSFTNYMYVGERTTVRNFLSYNLANNRVSPLKSSDRLSPLSTEIIYTPKYFITVYLKQGQQIDPLRFQSAQLDIKVGETEKVYLNVGAFYQYYPDMLKNDYTGLYYENPSAYRSKQLDNTLGFGLWITPKWRIDYNIRLTSRIDKLYMRMNDHELKLYRDLHCYNLGVTWRIRGIYHEVFFKFDLKTNMPYDRTNQDKQSEEDKIFYPWR
jgi:LPS-assembly protein